VRSATRPGIFLSDSSYLVVSIFSDCTFVCQPSCCFLCWIVWMSAIMLFVFSASFRNLIVKGGAAEFFTETTMLFFCR
jgi:hypothetical protein